MPDTQWEKKAEIKEAMRDVLIGCGSPVTMTTIHDRVQDKLEDGNPSYSTIKTYLKDFERHGFVQHQQFANGFVFWFPTENNDKLKEFKKMNFEKKDE